MFLGAILHSRMKKYLIDPTISDLKDTYEFFKFHEAQYKYNAQAYP